MKKLNNKGFTLVELLAVIIILAIVVGITIPAVTTTTNNARKSAFNTAASVAADWFDRQYQAAGIGDTSVATVSSYYTAVCVTKKCTSANGLTAGVLTSDAITAAGLKAANIVVGTANSVSMTDALAKDTATSYVMINTTTGRSCVKLVSTTDGQYPKTKVACGGVCSNSQCVSTN